MSRSFPLLTVQAFRVFIPGAVVQSHHSPLWPRLTQTDLNSCRSHHYHPPYSMYSTCQPEESCPHDSHEGPEAGEKLNPVPSWPPEDMWTSPQGSASARILTREGSEHHLSLTSSSQSSPTSFCIFQATLSINICTVSQESGLFPLCMSLSSLYPTFSENPETSYTKVFGLTQNWSGFPCCQAPSPVFCCRHLATRSTIPRAWTSSYARN